MKRILIQQIMEGQKSLKCRPPETLMVSKRSGLAKLSLRLKILMQYQDSKR